MAHWRTLLGCVLLAACQARHVELGPLPPAARVPAGAIAAHERACTVAYGNGRLWLLENHCDGATLRRLTLIDAAGVRHFASYDPRFTDWAWREGCDAPADCHYTAALDGHGAVTSFTYRFVINLSEGEIVVTIDDGALTVSRKTIRHQPS